MIPSVSIQEKSASSRSFNAALSPFSKAATTARSDLTTASSGLVAGLLVCATTKPADTAHITSAKTKFRFICNLLKVGSRCAHLTPRTGKHGGALAQSSRDSHENQDYR